MAPRQTSNSLMKRRQGVESFKDKHRAYEERIAYKLLSMLAVGRAYINDNRSRGLALFNEDWLGRDLGLGACRVTTTLSMPALMRGKLEKTGLWEAYVESRSNWASRGHFLLFAGGSNRKMPNIAIHDHPALLVAGYWSMTAHRSTGGEPYFIQTQDVVLLKLHHWLEGSL